MARPLVVAAGLDPRSVRVVLVGDPSINAFVMQGQAVYLHSGLIHAADNVEQVQGVVAHELGHITGGHAVRFSEGMAAATGITIMSLLLGAAAAAAGAPDAAMAIMRSEEHTSELQSLMRISYAVFCLKKKIQERNSKSEIKSRLVTR